MDPTNTDFLKRCESNPGKKTLRISFAIFQQFCKLKTIISPRQARDEHGEKHSQKERLRFLSSAIYTRCSIQWSEGWSRDGMMAVPRVMLGDLLLNVEDDEEVIRHVVSIHESCGHQAGQRGRAAGFPQRQFCSLLSAYNR